MKLLIACDMEGISGVVSWDHVTPGHVEYERFRKIMTGDVNAAIRGAVHAGAEEVIVADGHWNSGNILIEELDGRARLICGSPSPLSMVEGIESGVDAVMFVGYHARVGTPNAICDHTWSSRTVSNLWLNGRPTGEIGLNGAVCGHFNAPVLMVSGDQSACAEAHEFLGQIDTCIVKRAVGRHAAECLTPADAQNRIRETAARAVSQFRAGNGPEPYRIVAPIEAALEFNNSEMADKASLLPGAVRLDGRRIRVTSDDMVAAYKAVRAAINLAK